MSEIFDTPEATITSDERPSGDGLGTARTVTIEPKPGTPEHNRTLSVRRAEQALTDLRAYIALSNPTAAQTAAVVKLLCRVAVALVRLQLGRHEGTD